MWSARGECVCVCKRWWSRQCVFNRLTCDTVAFSRALSTVLIFLLNLWKRSVSAWKTPRRLSTLAQRPTNFAARGQLLPENRRFPSHHPHTWVLFAALASISILLQHCLEHGEMVGIVSVGSLKGGGDTRKVTHRHHQTSRHLCSRVEVIHWIHFYSWNSHCPMNTWKKCVIETELLRKVMLISAFLAA